VQNQVNGQFVSHSCLVDWDTRDTWDIHGACAGLNPDMSQMGPGESTGSCGSSSGPAAAAVAGLKRDDGASCPIGNGGPGGTTISFTSGPTAKPTCSAAGKCGGTLCTGFYCTPSPTGVPPDHQDPKDPNNGKPVPTTTIDSGFTTTSSTGPTSTCDDKCKLDRGNPCTCNESGCDANSPACCGSATCPKCDCTQDTGQLCTPSSPACCGSGTCAWSWTGGGGGFGDRKFVTFGFFANVSKPAAVYDIWSRKGVSGGSFEVSGYDGQLLNACNATAEWSDRQSSGLQTTYTNLTVYGDTCRYQASVTNYTDVDIGAQVGALACLKWTPATCYRANSTKEQACGIGSMTEELVCQWF
jgi:hypothetical protein